MTSGLDWPERAVSVNNPANVLRQARIAADPYRAVLLMMLHRMGLRSGGYNGNRVNPSKRLASADFPPPAFPNTVFFFILRVQSLLWSRSRRNNQTCFRR
jgi:hypothetical protein